MSQLAPIKQLDAVDPNKVMLFNSLALAFLVEQHGGQLVIPKEDLDRIEKMYPLGMTTQLYKSKEIGASFLMLSLSEPQESKIVQ